MSKAARIRARSTSEVCTDDSYTRHFTWPPHGKSSGARSSEQTDQGIGPALSRGRLAKLLTTTTWCTANGTYSNNLGSISLRNTMYTAAVKGVEKDMGILNNHWLCPHICSLKICVDGTYHCGAVILIGPFMTIPTIWAFCLWWHRCQGCKVHAQESEGWPKALQ